jgi:hypothetical protein
MSAADSRAYAVILGLAVLALSYARENYAEFARFAAAQRGRPPVTLEAVIAADRTLTEAARLAFTQGGT